MIYEVVLEESGYLWKILQKNCSANPRWPQAIRVHSSSLHGIIRKNHIPSKNNHILA